MEEKLLQLIQKSYTNVPMYMKLLNNSIPESISEVPIVDKNYVIANESGAIAADAIMLYYSDKLMKCRTSGSTGKYMEIYWKESDYNKSMLPLWYLRKKYYGIDTDDKMCYFYTLNETSGEEYGKIKRKNSIGYSKSNLGMDELREVYWDIYDEKPRWLLLQPSMAVLLCRCVKKYELPKIETIEYIEMNGEILSEQVRNEVREIFGCKVANQYGANEFNSIAYECPWGNMHIQSSNVYVEVMNNAALARDGEEGELIITTKTNTAMPLIRYRLGDIGNVTHSKCPCGNTRPILKLTSGRVNDYIVTKSGEKKSVYTIVRAIDMVNYMTEGAIKQFQIVQNAEDMFTIKLVIDEDEVDEFVMCDMEGQMISAIEDTEIRECDFKFEYYEEMFPEQIMDERGEYVGKFKCFKREI